MRRKEKEIVDPERIGQILRDAKILRLGLSVNDQPYIVPLCFGYAGRTLYFHCAPEGRKLDMIRKNDQVCFEAESDFEFVAGDEACTWSVKYRSVIGFGIADVVTEPEAKRQALDVIMRQYSDKSFQYTDQAIAKMVVIRVRIESMTGKESGFVERD